MHRGHYDPWKRTIDVVVASLALVVSAPMQLVIAAMVRKCLGPPVLFRQLRPGEDDQVFRMVKFRPMLEPDGSPGLESDADRTTPFGEWLRSTSLDEIPTLWNVVKGDMSLVGPRPLLMAYLDGYSARERVRHEVRPGVTGLAQVNGRNGISWPEKFAFDVRYVTERSLSLDFAIMRATVATVVRRRGVDANNGETMPKFLGTVGPSDSEALP